MRLLALCAILITAAPCVWCQVSPDEDTTFLCSFDRSLDADFSLGDWSAASGRDVTIEPGKFGGAAYSSSRGITYRAPGNLALEAGTVALWVQPLWLHDGEVNASVFTFRTDTGDFFNLNVVYGKRLGIAVRTGGEDWVWHRADLDVTDWDPDQWRHIAATWGDGELRFFVDGQQVDQTETGLKSITGEVGDFMIAGGKMRVDALRISSVPRSAEELADASSPDPRPRQWLYVSDLPSETTGTCTVDGLADRAHLKLPLILGDTVYARGLGMLGAAASETELPAGYATLTGSAGFSQLSGEASAALVISGDGRQLWSSDGGEPKPFEIDVTGVGKLRLETSGAPQGAHPLAVWGEVRLLSEDARPPKAFSRPAEETDIAMARMRLDSERYQFVLPDSALPYHLYTKSSLDDLDPTPAHEATGPPQLRTFASCGEYEPVSFVICARHDLRSVTVAATDLKGEAGTIPAREIDIHWVLRGPQRKGYWMKPDQTEVTSRFLMPNEPFDLMGGRLREMFVDIHVPTGTDGGVYSGQIRITADGARERSIDVMLRVLPIELPQAQLTRYGMYYRMSAALLEKDRARLELEDMRDHGVTTLFLGIGVHFGKQAEAVTHSCDDLREALSLMREADYAGTVPVHDGLITLGRLLGHSVGGPDNAIEEGLEDDPQMLALAKAAFDEVKRIDDEFPEFTLALTHMDEVFNNKRLPLYIQLAKIVRKTTDLPLYITHHTSPTSKWETMMAQSDPYVDIRSMNGHALDDWLRAGHTFEELAQQGEESGDELWTYYNMRGSFFTPEWCRIVNGYYMWLSPLTVHIPWMYHSFGGDPFDDTDSDRYDFGYSVPSARDGVTPVPTLHFKGFREGVDDMRYLELLERLISRGKELELPQAKAAEDWLKTVRGLMPAIPEEIADIEGESPVLIFISQRYTGEDYQRMRYGIAEQVMRLQEALEG